MQGQSCFRGCGGVNGGEAIVRGGPGKKKGMRKGHACGLVT